MKKKLLDLKSIFVGIIVGSLLFGGIVTASTLVYEVYLNSYPIYANGNLYNSTLPLLNYQGRTYVPLSEFGNLTKSNVRFVNNTIFVESSDYNYNQNYAPNYNQNPNYYPNQNYSEITLDIDNTDSFFVNLNRYGASSANINYNNEYIKLSKAYLTYSEAVNITGRKEGKATIMITYNTGDVEYVYVNIEDDEEEYEYEFKVELGAKKTHTIDLEEYDADKATLYYDDEYIKLSKTTFYSSGKVTITARKEGETTIKVKYDTGDVEYIYVEVFEDDDSYFEDDLELEVGEEHSIYIDLDEYRADRAILSYDDYYIDLSKTNLTKSGKVTVTGIRKGNTRIRVTYQTVTVDHFDYIDVEIY